MVWIMVYVMTAFLSAALTLANGTTVTLVQLNNGAWAETARAANG